MARSSNGPIFSRIVAIPQLHRGGQTQLEIAEEVGVRAETVSRMVECTGVSGASDSERPATGSGPFPSEPRAGIAAVIGSNPLLCRPHVSATQYAVTHSVNGAEETFRRVPGLLPQGSQTAPICSPVSSHAALAKCEHAAYLDSIGGRFWIPLYGTVCEHAPPRFGGSGTIDDNAMEQWSY